MGVDIHMSAYHADGTKIEDFHFFEGQRNSEWFDNICGNGYDWKYDEFPWYNVTNQKLPEEICKYIEESGYYGFHMLTIGDLRKWWDRYKPNRAAGWFTSYDQWKLTQGWVPTSDDDIPTWKPEGEDWHFLEYERYDIGTELLDYTSTYRNDDIIYYFFDR